MVSPDSRVIKSLDDIEKDDQVIVISGTTAETYLTKNYPDIKLQKYDSYAEAKTAFENGNGVAWANDNTEVIAYALENRGYTVGIPSLGSADTIAPAVSKGNSTLLNWLNDEIWAIWTPASPSTSSVTVRFPSGARWRCPSEWWT